MSRGQLHHILTNAIYAGRIRHKGQVFEGQHEAIIDLERWDGLQEHMTGTAAKARRTKQHLNPSPLARKIIDEAGERLTPSHTKKGGRRYRYYISQKLVTGMTRADEKQRTWRIPAGALEKSIAGAVQKRLKERTAASNEQRFRGAETPDPKAHEALNAVQRVRIAPGNLTIELNAEQLQKEMGTTLKCDQSNLTINLTFTERRRGAEMKIIIEGGMRQVDQTLLDNVILANHCCRRLREGASFEAIAGEVKTSKRRVQQIVDLAFLAPDIVRDVTNGTHPLGLTSDCCLRHALPADWQAQRERIANL